MTIRYIMGPLDVDGNQTLFAYEEQTDGTLIPLQRVASTAVPASILCGENADVDTTAEQITADSTPCQEVLVQARKANTGTISVGNASTQPIELAAGESIAIPVDDANKVYVKASADNQAVGWLAKP